MTETRHDGYDRLMVDFREQLREAEKLRAGGQPRRRRALIAVGGLAAVGLVGGALMLTGAGGGGRLDLVAQAEAALAPAGQIVHLVTTSHMEMRGGSQSGIVGPEAEGNTPRVSERWSSSKPLRWRVASTSPIVTAHGTLTGTVELSYGEGTEELYVQPLNTLSVQTGLSEDDASRRLSGGGPLGTDPVARVHAMLEDGQLHNAGSGTVDGHTVLRLVGQELSPPLRSAHSPWPVEYDVDPETYAPVRFTVEEVGVSFPGNTGVPTQVVDVNTYELLPLNESTTRLLSIHPTGSPTIERHQAGEPEASAARAAYAKQRTGSAAARKAR
jgi:hypothetical protein